MRVPSVPHHAKKKFSVAHVMARQAIVVASYYLFGWARKPGTQSRRRRGSETNDCWECQERVGIELQLDWGGNERRPVTFINPYTGARSFCCSEFCSWFELPRTSKHHNLLQVRYPARNSALEIKDLFSMVGAGRFERPTPCAQGRCATRLRYAPTGLHDNYSLG
jgi:hypothetical protein